MQLLNKIIEASERLRGVAIETPLTYNKLLSYKYGANIYLKREDLQVVRSFKLRGAYNKIKGMVADTLHNGVVCASAGNHAQGVAYSCSRLKIKGVIFMPVTTPNQKVSKVKYFGEDWVEVKLTGDTFDDCQQTALQFAEQCQAAFIHPFDDEEVIAGQGTIAYEISRQADFNIDSVIVPIGGGGLVSGVGSFFKESRLSTKIIAVESEGAPTFYQSKLTGQRVKLDKIDSFADGIAVKQMGKTTFEIANRVVDEQYLVNEGNICSTILSLYNDEAIVVEPAGAIGIAALDQIKSEIKGKNIVIIVCGGNNDITRTEDIRERALLWENKKHYFIIRFPQRAGALREFLNVLGPEDDITHFQYTKKTNREAGPALVGIELKHREGFATLVNNMKNIGINFEHLNNNPMLFEMLV